MRTSMLATLGLVMVLTPAGVQATAEESAKFDDFEELDLESLLDQVVTTAARHEQRLSETPVATTVVTAQDIAATGATTIPDALRYVPGLDVMATTVTGMNVSARGMNELVANTMMVLLDGRSVYAGFYGVILWEHLPVTLDEIERIEITRSPGSALYGANAFAGVINIITRDPKDLSSALVRTTAQQYGSVLTNVVHAGSQGDVDYKFSGSLNHIDNWDRPDDYPSGLPRLNGFARFNFDDGSFLTLSGGGAKGDTRNYASVFARAVTLGGRTSYARADYERDQWRVRAFLNSYDLNVEPSEAEDTFNPVTGLRADDLDFELQRNARPHPDHLLILGASYSHSYIDWSTLDTKFNQDKFALSIYDEWRLSGATSLSLGLRYDYHPLVKSHVSPRGSIVHRLRDRHTLRASVSRAHRNPSYLESYFEFSARLDALPDLPLQVTGNQDLDSEQITSFELGYQGLLRPSLLGSVDVFHNRIRDLVEIASVKDYAVPPAPFPGVPEVLSFVNFHDRNATGGEVALDWRPLSRVRTRANYAYVHVVNPRTNTIDEQTPAHKANLHVKVSPTSDLDLHVMGRYNARTEWTLILDQIPRTVEMPAFWVFDVGLGYSILRDRLDLRAGVRNVLDESHQEYPLGIEFRSQYYVTTAVRF